MKRFVLVFLTIFLTFSIAKASEDQICGIGVSLIQDPYNKKIFVLKVLPNSSALEYNLPEGAEIIAVNDKKIKKMNKAQITNLIRGEEGTIVKLTIKYNNEQSIFEIPRKQFKIPEKVQDKFELHWRQVAPANARIEPIPQNMINNMSKKWYNEVVPFTNYWLNRKTYFKNGYDACMTYPASEQNTCLMNLTNREINKTSQDKQIELQENMIKQQAVQNFINNMNQIQTNTNLNNINNTLQQRNFQLQNTNTQLYNINNTLMGW